MTNRKSTKKALLTSFLCLLLCFSMLVGTTFAWFTDSVESGVNQIIAGNLDVEVYTEDGNSIQDVTTLFNDVTLWEPGAVAYENLTVANLGTLALKYALSINFDNENTVLTNGEAYGLSQVLKIAVVNGGFDKSLTREQVLEKVEKDENAEWQLLSAWAVNDYLQKQGDTHTYGVVIWWEPSENDNNWNVQNGKTTSDGEKYLHIDLGVKLVATQKDAESDSFGSDYDKTASVVVEEDGLTLAQAIKQVEDGGIVFIEPGTYVLKSGPIVIENKNVTIIGLGDVTLVKDYNNTHIFTVKNGANVTIENLTMDGNGKTREGIYVRWNSKVTLKDVVIKNTGGKDIMIDEASDAAHGQVTASYVWMINSHIEDVAMCASPVTSVAATQDTYVYFNYDASSTVGSIDVQSINQKPENIIINGVASTEVGKTMNLYVSNDAELAAALETIQTNSEYWNKQVYVYMAAGEYSGDYVINQYPKWNGTAGRNTGNNYQGGVPAGDPSTVITFVGETVSSYSLRGAQSVPAVTFTGNVTVNGFADSMAGFDTAVAVTTFQNIAFDAANSADEADSADAVVMYVTAAASNVNFEGCTFANATHVTLGGSSPNGIGNVSFTGCTFDNGGCLSGYPQNLTITDCVVEKADNGFINIQSGGDITVKNCTVNAGKYFIRTKSSGGATLTVQDSDITMYESEGTKHLVYFRGSNESAKFVDCTIADGWTTDGVDANSTLEIYNYSETEDGLTLVTDGITDEVTLYLVPADYEGTTVTVPEGVDTIGSYAFYYNSNIEKIILPSTVTTLNDRAFRGTSASEVVLNEGLTNISYQAFRDASNVKTVVIPSTVTTISKEAFQLSGITTLTIPATVTNIEYGACRDMKELTTVTIEGDVYIPNYAFRACEKLETVYITGANVTFGSGMIFTNYDTGDGSTITVHVANDAIKARLYAADSAAKNYDRDGDGVKGYTIVCEQTADENGVYTDDDDSTYAYASDSSALSTAITNGADTVYLSSGTYTLPSAAKGKTLTIRGTEETKISVTSGLSYAVGATVTFDGVTIQSEPEGNGYTNGFADFKYAVFNNCVINGTLGLDFSCEFNNCEFNIEGNYYNVWTWGAGTATFNGCTFNCDGKALLVYANVLDNGTYHQTVNITDCVFNDNGDDTVTGKAAIEISNTYTPVRTYDVIITKTKVNGFSQTVPGANDFNAAYGSVAGSDIGTNVWGNKCRLPNTQINVVIDGVDVY